MDVSKTLKVPVSVFVNEKDKDQKNKDKKSACTCRGLGQEIKEEKPCALQWTYSNSVHTSSFDKLCKQMKDVMQWNIRRELMLF